MTESSFDIAELGKELLEWERIYNTVRPHQALGYLTPSVFLEQQKYHQAFRNVTPYDVHNVLNEYIPLLHSQSKAII